MPIYEYRCRACGRTIEVIQKFSDSPLTRCEACSGRLEKLVSVSAFRLKGSGWFSDDYGKGKSKESKPADPAPESGAADKPDASAKSEPASSESAPSKSKAPEASKAKSSKPDSAKPDSPKSKSGGC